MNIGRRLRKYQKSSFNGVHTITQIYVCIYSAVYNKHNTLFCLLLCAACPQKERTCETRSLSAESWQSCWTTRRACLTQRTMTSPPPTTTAPLTNRYLLFLTSSSSQSITSILSVTLYLDLLVCHIIVNTVNVHSWFIKSFWIISDIHKCVRMWTLDDSWWS